MIMVTTDMVPGKTIAETFGLVQGTSVRAIHVGQDIGGRMQNLVGGEVAEYTKLFAEVREQCLDRMCAEAKVLGANAIVGVRMTSTEISSGAAELLIYGTAVRLAD